MLRKRLYGLGVLLVAGAILVSAVLASGVSLSEPVRILGQTNSQSDSARSIESCTTITEPGNYELASDLDGAGEDVCLHVRASNVTLVGDGHTIAGDGTENSIGLFVFGAERRGRVDSGETLENVTARDVAMTNWEYGAQIGDVDESGTPATLENVIARNNSNAGVYFLGVENTVVNGLETTNNGAGVRLWEVQDTTFRNITASENDGTGLALTQDVYRVELLGVTSTGNGNSGSGNGIYLSTDARDNLVTDAYLANNTGAGIEFSDSDENVIQDTVVESNDGPGILGKPANEEHLQNVTTRSNAGFELQSGSDDQRPGTGLYADSLDIDGVASVTFQDESVNLEPFDTDEVATPETESIAVERGLNVTNVDNGVGVSFDGVGDGSVELWQSDSDVNGEDDWSRVGDSTHDPETGTVSGTVTRDGLVVPLQTGDGDENDESTTTTDETTSTTNGATATTTDDTTTTLGDDTTTTIETTSTPNDTTTPDATTTTDGGDDDASTFVVTSTQPEYDFGYILVVDGDVERSKTSDVAADDTDRIVDSGDGTVTVIGSTGHQSGDAYRITGDIEVFYTPAANTDYVLELDGENVTTELPRPEE